MAISMDIYGYKPMKSGIFSNKNSRFAAVVQWGPLKKRVKCLGIPWDFSSSMAGKSLIYFDDFPIYFWVS